MRILHWDANFLNGGAVATAVLGLARAQVRLGADVAIAAAAPSEAPMYGAMPGHDGVSIIEWAPGWTFECGGLRMRGLPSGARRRLQAFRPDLVHVHGGFNADNLWVPRVFECPLVLSPHGTYDPRVFTKGRRAAKTLYHHLEKRLLLRHVQAFHALSPMESGCLQRLLPGRQVYCVPQGPRNGHHLKIAQGHDAGSASEVGFVCVGRLDVFTKGLDLLLEAFAEAENRLAGRLLALTLVGPDWRGSMAWLRRRGRDLGIGDRVFFTGPLPPVEVGATLRRSHIYIQLSRHDAFSLSALEALLAGKPAILSGGVGLASYPEIASLAYVRIVPLSVEAAAAAMVECVRSLRTLASAAARCQREVSEFFSWDRVARSQLAAYDKLVAGKAVP